MGCVDSRTSLPDEERTILIFENRFGFNSWSSQNVDFTIRRFSHNSEINSKQLENIIIYLMLPHLNTPHSKSIDLFYNSYLNPSSESYNLQKLLITGIMQGNASPSHKARLLFEIMDPYCTGEISRAHLKELIRTMLDVSLYNLPLLVDDSRHPQSSEKAVKEYTEKLYSNKQSLLEELEKILIPSDIVKLKAFQDIIHEEGNEGLVSNHGIRMFCRKKSGIDKGSNTHLAGKPDKKSSSSSSSDSDHDKKDS